MSKLHKLKVEIEKNPRIWFHIIYNLIHKGTQRYENIYHYGAKLDENKKFVPDKDSESYRGFVKSVLAKTEYSDYLIR